MSIPAPAATAARIRRATPEDAHVAGRICYEAFAAISGHHNFPPDMPAPEIGVGLLGMLFSHPGFYCIVAESDGRIVGSNCLDERSIVAGLGPITVDPGVQNSGIGKLLMTTLLDRARDRRLAGVRLLQAAFHNRSLSLYAKLGFDAREPMSVMQGPSIKRAIDGCAVRSARESDVDAGSRVCVRVHGFDRAGELRDRAGILRACGGGVRPGPPGVDRGG